MQHVCVQNPYCSVLTVCAVVWMYQSCQKTLWRAPLGPLAVTMSQWCHWLMVTADAAAWAQKAGGRLTHFEETAVKTYRRPHARNDVLHICCSVAAIKDGGYMLYDFHVRKSCKLSGIYIVNQNWPLVSRKELVEKLLIKYDMIISLTLLVH